LVLILMLEYIFNQFCHRFFHSHEFAYVNVRILRQVFKATFHNEITIVRIRYQFMVINVFLQRFDIFYIETHEANCVTILIHFLNHHLFDCFVQPPCHWLELNIKVDGVVRLSTFFFLREVYIAAIIILNFSWVTKLLCFLFRHIFNNNNKSIIFSYKI